MSFRFRFSCQVTLDEASPPELIEWIESSRGGRVEPPRFPVPPEAEGLVDEAARVLAAARTDLEVAWERRDPETGATDRAFELSVQATVHESEGMGPYGLVLVLGPFCCDGFIGVLGTDMPADVEPTLFFVQDATLFVGFRNGTPITTDEADAPVPWKLGVDRPRVRELTDLGVADPASMVESATASGEPLLARHLLSRSVERGLRDLDLEDLLADGATDRNDGDEDRLRRAARAGALLVLDLLDEGGDPLVVRDTPGWTVQEVERHVRFGSRPIRGSGRAITRLALGLADVGTSSLDAGPKRLAVGEVLEVIAPLTLAARGPMVWWEDDGGNRVGGHQHLAIAVPVGARLVVTEVYDKGHANCRPVDADLFDWLTTQDRSSGQPHEPVAEAAAYSLGWIVPGDEGRTFERRAAAERR